MARATPIHAQIIQGTYVKKILLILATVGTLSGCANSSGARMGLFTATAPVFAVLFDDLLIGEAVGYLDGSGTLDIKSAINPDLRCVGGFKYTGMKLSLIHI